MIRTVMNARYVTARDGAEMSDSQSHNSKITIGDAFYSEPPAGFAPWGDGSRPGGFLHEPLTVMAGDVIGVTVWNDGNVTAKIVQMDGEAKAVSEPNPALDDSNRQVICPGCGGDGDCVNCSGTGEGDEPDGTCDWCGDTGDCIDCDGAGEVPLRAYRELTGAEPPEEA